MMLKEIKSYKTPVGKLEKNWGFSTNNKIADTCSAMAVIWAEPMMLTAEIV